MKLKITALTACLAVALYSANAFADDAHSDQQAQLEGIETFQQEFMNQDVVDIVGEQGLSLVAGDLEDQVMALQEEAEEDEDDSVYVYDGDRGPFHGVTLPQRTFNNIEYPY